MCTMADGIERNTGNATFADDILIMSGEDGESENYSDFENSEGEDHLPKAWPGDRIQAHEAMKFFQPQRLFEAWASAFF